MALKDVIHQKKIVESVIKRSVEQEERRILSFVNSTEKGNSSLSRFTQQMLIDRSVKNQLKKALSISRARGLSVSLKKQSPQSLILSGKNISANPQLDVYKQIRSRRVKMAETLMKTAHTVGELDKSVNEINKNNSIDKRNNNQSDAFIEENRSITYYDKSRSSKKILITKNIQTSCKQMSNCNCIESVYDIRVSSPKKIQQNNKNFLGSPQKYCYNKLKDMKDRQFLRSSHFNKNNCFENREKVSNQQMQREFQLYLTNQKTFSVKNSQYLSPIIKKYPLKENERSYHSRLSKMISKPMINSVIIPQKLRNNSILQKQNQQNSQQLIQALKNQQQQPQSPVLRLKKRLEMNSINCIYERQTIISHYEFEINGQQMRQSQLQVQQSLIVHRSVMDDLVKVTKQQQCQFDGQKKQVKYQNFGYKRYLAVEKNINLLVTVKQMGLGRFEQFVQQLRVYEQIQLAKFRLTDQVINLFLGLVKHSTQQQTHLILKAPFTQTLQQYVLREKNVQMIQNFISSLTKTFNQLEKVGLTLNRKPKIQDFVILFNQIKIQNLTIFSINNNDSQKSQIKKQFFISQLSQQMIGLFINKHNTY